MSVSDSNWGSRPQAADETSNADSPSITSPQDGFDIQQIQALARHPPPGASVYSPSAVPSNVLNPRSCVTCRRRKVRCDKKMPCSKCARAHIPCIFPAPGRAPRRPRPKDPNAPSKQPSSERELELMKRLRKLEGIVEELSGQVEVEAVRQPSTAGTSPDGGPPRELDQHAAVGRSSGTQSTSDGNHSPISPSRGAAVGARPPVRMGTGNSNFGLMRKSSDVHQQFGRLVLNDKGVTRYVSSGFWSTINDELDEIRRDTQDLTDEESEESDDEASPESIENDRSAVNHQSFILGYRSADVDLRPLHPLPSQIPFMWQVYQENVDPILKVLHVPTTSKVIKDLRNNMDSLTPSNEALMFAIYYAAIVSLDDDEVKLNFGAEKDFLIQQYRFALEQALAKADFLTTPDLTVAQAFLLFLVLVRRHDDSRFSWTLTGLMIRISQGMGLHRDGSNFPNLSPFEVEMRRRLFWAVLTLDLRSAEDQGADLTIVERTFDTHFPLNINDADISPDSTELPPQEEHTTDMTFMLVRYEICSLARRLHTAASAMAPLCPRDAASTLEEREAMLADVHQRVANKYLRGDTIETSPMHWAAANIARLVVAKMTLIIYQPVLFPGTGREYLSEDKRSRLFNAAIDIFEYSNLLNSDPRCKQWRWLFKTYTQWHAVAYMLIEVAHRPWSATVERAWGALNLVFSEAKTLEVEKMSYHSAVWLPLRKMYLKAKRHRESEIARLQADPAAAQKLEIEDQCNSPPSSFGALSSSLKNAVAYERWRKLVNAPPLPPDMVQAPRQPEQQQPQQQQPPIPQPPPVQPVNTLPSQNTEARPEIMDYLDAAMTNPNFDTSIFPALWSRDAPSVDLTDPVFGFTQSDIPRSDNTNNNMANYNIPIYTNTSTPTLTPTSTTMSHFQPQVHLPQPGGAPPTASPPRESDLPPWMWSDASGTVDHMGRSNLPMEDVDINMDEGFDWQHWQENLGRWEVEANGGTTAGAWGPGI